jgi:hypothetical protein
MTLRFDGTYAWVSPVCLAVAGLMAYAGFNAEPAPVGGPLCWILCGGFAAAGTIFSVLGLVAAKQHLRVARAHISRQRRPDQIPSPSEW